MRGRIGAVDQHTRFRKMLSVWACGEEKSYMCGSDLGTAMLSQIHVVED